MQPVGYLKAWPRIWTRDDREQVQQVARAGLEPGTAGLQVRRADHLATLPPLSAIFGVTAVKTRHLLNPIKWLYRGLSRSIH